jgi:hypothetical protein
MGDMALAALALLQQGYFTDFEDGESRFVRTVIDCGTDEIREEYQAAADPDELRKYLKHDDRDVRRNAACLLALRGIADGRAELTVDDGDPWTRRVRIAEALLKIDRNGAAAVLRPLIDGPCLRARRAAARILGKAAREPAFTDAHRRAIEELSSDDAAVRDAATAALIDAPEAALLAARGTDLEARARLDHVIATIRERERLPVELIAGEIRRSEHGAFRRFTLISHLPQSLSYEVSDGGFLGCSYQSRAGIDDPWTNQGTPSMVTSISSVKDTLLAETPMTFEVVDDWTGEYRFAITLRDGPRPIIVYSAPLTPGK